MKIIRLHHTQLKIWCMGNEKKNGDSHGRAIRTCTTVAVHSGKNFLLAATYFFPLALLAQQGTINRDTLPQQHLCDTAQATHPADDIVPVLKKGPTDFLSSSLYGSISASYATSSNWYGRDQRNFALVGNLLYSHSLFAASHNHSHQLMADLGYLKFVDSTWEKSLDRLQVNLLWNNTGRKFNSSYTVAFGTQFLPSSFPNSPRPISRMQM